MARGESVAVHELGGARETPPSHARYRAPSHVGESRHADGVQPGFSDFHLVAASPIALLASVQAASGSFLLMRISCSMLPSAGGLVHTRLPQGQTLDSFFGNAL